MTEEEQQKQIDALKKENEETKKELAALKELLGKDKGKDEPEPEKTPIEMVKEQQKKEAEKKEYEKRITEAAQFTSTFKQTVTDGGEFFPPEVNKLIDLILSQKHESELEKADSLRANIITSVFSQQKNIDLLPEHEQQKVKDFLNLADALKTKQAASIWGNVLTAIDNYKRETRYKRIEQAKNNPELKGGYAALEGKMLGLRKAKGNK